MDADVDTYTGRTRYRTPGVYYEELTVAAEPEISTGIPVFVGFAFAPVEQKGLKPSRLRWLNCWEDFSAVFKNGYADGFLGYAVRGFFENGGERCTVYALPPPDRSVTVAGLVHALTDPFNAGHPLEDCEDADLVCVPDISMEPLWADPGSVADAQNAVLDYCARMGDRFAIIDTPQPLSIQTRSAPLSSFGAAYAPRLCVAQTSIPVPACGHIAGIYARSDRKVGVHKAPANEIVEGVLYLDPKTEITSSAQADLNEAGINCLRYFPGRGLRVWGARTLSGVGAWRYVNVRRLFVTVVRWMRRNLNDLVFEPNDVRTWQRVRTRLSSYCLDLLERGALKGRGPEEAFFIKCDAETNPEADREEGRLVVQVALAPVIPAEFVIVRITHTAAGVSITEPMG